MPKNTKVDTKTTETAMPVIEAVATTLENETKRDPTFADTATAAKMSGMFNVTAGKIKRKYGEFRGDHELHDEGRNQEILGKVHRLVGSIRSIREGSVKKVLSKRKETQAICIKHGGRMLDVASDLVEDLKKVLLK